MRGLRRRLARLEERLGAADALEPTDEEQAALGRANLGSTDPADLALAMRAMIKFIGKHGLEAVVLASYGRGPLCEA